MPQPAPLAPLHPAAPAPAGPPSYASASPPWGQVGPWQGWSGPVATDSEAAQALRSARTALGWAIGAAVGAGLALVLCVVLLVTGFGSIPMEGDYYGETLRGEVVGVSEGSRLDGDRLEDVVGGLLDDYGIDHEITCPDTAAVTTSTVVVCRGDVDDFEWTGVVVFEDSVGSFAVVEL